MNRRLILFSFVLSCALAASIIGTITTIFSNANNNTNSTIHVSPSSTSLWKTCLFLVSEHSAPICSDYNDDSSSCSELFASVEASRTFAVLACIFTGVAVVFSFAQIRVLNLRREKSWRRVLTFFLIFAMICSCIEFSIVFTLFTRTFCGQPSQYDCGSELGANPFLFVANFILNLGCLIFDSGVCTGSSELNNEDDDNDNNSQAMSMTTTLTNRDNAEEGHDHDVYQPRYSEKPVDFTYHRRENDDDKQQTRKLRRQYNDEEGGSRNQRQIAVNEEKVERETWVDL